jgi:acyl-coenzyme A synthetase/AMP-(fatty) acid ligase
MDVSLTGVIGHPLPNNRLYIFDANLCPTLIGVEGELFIGGIQLARGYLNQPEQSEKWFVPSPFIHGEHLYGTDDVAVCRTDGNIIYCGRHDCQIKLRGQRIELCEIKDVLNKYQSAQRAAVLIRDLRGAPAVVAFVELKSSIAEDHATDAKKTLKMHIPECLDINISSPTSPCPAHFYRRDLVELNLAVPRYQH